MAVFCPTAVGGLRVVCCAIPSRTRHHRLRQQVHPDMSLVSCTKTKVNPAQFSVQFQLFMVCVMPTSWRKHTLVWKRQLL